MYADCHRVSLTGNISFYRIPFLPFTGLLYHLTVARASLHSSFIFSANCFHFHSYLLWGHFLKSNVLNLSWYSTYFTILRSASVYAKACLGEALLFQGYVSLGDLSVEMVGVFQGRRQRKERNSCAAAWFSCWSPHAIMGRGGYSATFQYFGVLNILTQIDESNDEISDLRRNLMPVALLRCWCYLQSPSKTFCAHRGATALKWSFSWSLRLLHYFTCS